MVRYEEDVLRRVQKGKVPKDVFVHINNAFTAIDKTRDLKLFDTKKLKTSGERIYFRLRKGKYRAIFYIYNKDIYVISIGKREEVYKKWL